MISRFSSFSTTVWRIWTYNHPPAILVKSWQGSKSFHAFHRSSLLYLPSYFIFIGVNIFQIAPAFLRGKSSSSNGPESADVAYLWMETYNSKSGYNACNKLDAECCHILGLITFQQLLTAWVITSGPGQRAQSTYFKAQLKSSILFTNLKSIYSEPRFFFDLVTSSGRISLLIEFLLSSLTPHSVGDPNKSDTLVLQRQANAASMIFSVFGKTDNHKNLPFQ